jgi:hypothetical protein
MIRRTKWHSSPGRGVALLVVVIACCLVVVGLVRTQERYSNPPRSGAAAADNIRSSGSINPDYYSDPSGMTFRHVGAQWVRNDMEDCAGNDREALEGNPNYYPQVCKLTGDGASAADAWWKKMHPAWSVKAAYAAQAKAMERWYGNHMQAEQPNGLPQPDRSKPASPSADDVLRCLNVFPSNNPAKRRIYGPLPDGRPNVWRNRPCPLCCRLW